jgi:hypothetical protein
MGTKQRIGKKDIMVGTKTEIIAKLQEMVDSYLSGGHDQLDECDDYAEQGPYSIDKIPDGGPPYHPNCECTLIPAEDPNSKPVDPTSYFDLIDGRMVDVPEELLTVI